MTPKIHSSPLCMRLKLNYFTLAHNVAFSRYILKKEWLRIQRKAKDGNRFYLAFLWHLHLLSWSRTHGDQLSPYRRLGVQDAHQQPVALKSTRQGPSFR